MIKFCFFGSDNYSKIVLEELLKDKRFKLVEKEAEAQVGILASYGKILKKETLRKLEKGIFNVHPSLLPKYRGPTPVQSALIAGEKETGVTVFKIDEKVDHGPILDQKRIKIEKNDTSISLYKKLFVLGAQILKESLPNYLQGEKVLTEQDHRKASFTIPKLTKDNAFIDLKIIKMAMEGKEGQEKINFSLTATAENLNNIIRALYPWPCVWTKIRPNKNSSIKRLKIISSHTENKRLILDKVQLEGKKEVTFKQFKEGYPNSNL